MGSPYSPIALASKLGATERPPGSLERLVNCYAEPQPQGARSTMALRGRPGLTLLMTAGTGRVNGLRVMGGELYVVSGEEIYVVGPSLVPELLGPVSGNGQAYMIDNGVHIGLATGTHGYAVNRDGVIELAEGNLNGAAYTDGYGIFTQGGGEQWWITAADDMTTISGLDFSAADNQPDPVLACIMYGRVLLLGGASTIEAWVNTGAVFPFERQEVISKGVAGSGAMAGADNSVFWLAPDRTVNRLDGLTPTRISTQEVERALWSVNSVSGARLWIQEERGRRVLVVQYSGGTLCHDLSTGLWHERRTYDATTWEVYSAVTWRDRFLLGGPNGAIYQASHEVYDDAGSILRREAVFPPLYAQGGAAIMHELLIEAEMGVGLDGAGQGSDPVLMLDWSDDHGHTWSDEIEVGLGAIGARDRLATAVSLGRFRQRALRIALSDAVEFNVTGARARLETAL